MKKQIMFLIIGIILGGLASYIVFKPSEKIEVETNNKSELEVTRFNGKKYSLADYKPEYVDSMILVYDLSIGENKIIKLPIDEKNVIINWGDDEKEVIDIKKADGIFHIYNSSKVKDIVVVEIKGNFKKFYIEELIDTSDTIFIESQKKLVWVYRFNSSLEDGTLLFAKATNLVQIPKNPSNKFTNMKGMFAFCENFNEKITFDTSKVTSMESMFAAAFSFNQPINFNTSNVKNIENMFNLAISFNQPINFDISEITSTWGMFLGAKKFNNSVNFINTRKLTSTEAMFQEATSFNQRLSFNTSNVTNMANMFYNAISFNTLPYFNTSNVTDMTSMFYNATSFNQDVTQYFNLSKVVWYSGIFMNSNMSEINSQKFYDKIKNRNN